MNGSSLLPIAREASPEAEALLCCSYLHVGRDPRDAAMSWDNHLANVDFDRMIEETRERIERTRARIESEKSSSLEDRHAQ